MKKLVSPMVGVAMASFMLSAHADFIDDSHAELIGRFAIIQREHTARITTLMRLVVEVTTGVQLQTIKPLQVQTLSMTVTPILPCLTVTSINRVAMW